MRYATALAVPVHRLSWSISILQPFLHNLHSLCVPCSKIKKTLKPIFWEFKVIQGHQYW